MDVQDKDALLNKVATEEFQMLPQETGWRVLIRGIWVEKKGNGGMKRMYASREAAKVVTEGRFKSAYFSQFRKDNCYSDLFKVGSGLCIGPVKVLKNWEEFDKAMRQGFRRWMNELYKDKAVEYQEAKAE